MNKSICAAIVAAIMTSQGAATTEFIEDGMDRMLSEVDGSLDTNGFGATDFDGFLQGSDEEKEDGDGRRLEEREVEGQTDDQERDDEDDGGRRLVGDKFEGELASEEEERDGGDRRLYGYYGDENYADYD